MNLWGHVLDILTIERSNVPSLIEMANFNNFIFFVLVVLGTLVYAPLVPRTEASGNDTNQTVYDLLSSKIFYSTFFTLVKRSVVLSTVLSNATNVTVFAPVNQAFYTLPIWVLHTFQNPVFTPFLDAIVQYHVHTGSNVYTSELKSDQPISLTTLWPGVYLKVQTQTSDDNVIDNTTGSAANFTNATVNDAHIIANDLNGSNGIIQGIDRILTPLYYLNGSINAATMPNPTQGMIYLFSKLMQAVFVVNKSDFSANARPAEAVRFPIQE
ncbi:FAS1 domain-containing protein [Jimgerdemannia flammicorona]|uniref:FAS1 domain-containing protein n=2 Tax=Jimgerdemannia flammicorona TaxID=994334 RepID=A0A433Q861_9FUNG|nr:FAS1 domain-containing protein [Jimgerdemannia flammicorona]RUS25952.1 FAS1 domain-containing protein [Jimgerdemannia flammicorona]